MMCRSCATAAEPMEIPADLERPDHGLSRRGLLAGLGLGVLAVNLSVGTSTAAAATAKNGAWADPALGRFPAGGHYGAPRGGASHAGQDVSNSVGTAVYAAAGGTVVRRSWGGGLPGRTGNALVISHGNNQYTYYGHLNAYRVGLNAKVSAGQRIADMGATGNVTGPHLHFETHSGRLGTTVNPVSFLAARGVDLSGGWSRTDPGASGATVVVIQHLMSRLRPRAGRRRAVRLRVRRGGQAVPALQGAGGRRPGRTGHLARARVHAAAGRERVPRPGPAGRAEQAQRATGGRRRVRFRHHRRRTRLPERQPPGGRR